MNSESKDYMTSLRNAYHFLTSGCRHLKKEFIIGNNCEISYPELFTQVDQLYNLIINSYKNTHFIVLCSTNNPFFIVSYLAILKSGKTCVLIDPSFSEAINDHIIEQTEPGLILTQSEFEGAYTKYRIPTISELILEEKSSANEGDAGGIEVDFNSTALIIYTSGSTGFPKGVMLSHKNISANTASIIKYLQLTDSDIQETILPFYYSYGLSLLNTHLKIGGSMVINNDITNPDTIVNDIITRKCTGLAGVPSAYQFLIRNSSFLQASMPSLRYMTQAGGKLPVPFVKEIGNFFPDKEFFIMYGATEATARLTYLDPGNVISKPGSVGKAIPGVRIEILNEDGNQIKHGEQGELVAFGDNIMKGYFKEEELSGSVFHKGGYRTGDIATIDDEGFIHIVDRKGDFIKSAGYKVSPKEIEDTILENENILECAVIGVEDPDFGELIKAFVVVKDISDISINSLERECARKLPPHKQPYQIDIIDKLPKNSFGKIVKTQLKEYQGKERGSLEEVQDADTNTSEAITEIIKNSLGVDDVGIHDDFLRMGINSILGVRIILRINKQLHIELSIKSLLENPSIFELTRFINEKVKLEKVFEKNEIKPIPRDKELVTSYSQQRLWFLDQFEKERSFFNVSASFRLRGVLDVPVLHRSLNGIVLRHEALRTSFKSVEGVPFQVIKPSIEIDLPVIDLNNFKESKRESEFQILVADEVRRSFNLAVGPLIRCTLLRFDEFDHVLVLVMHHIISDGWSMGIFKSELSCFYNNFAQELQPSLGALPIQYADFAHWQRQWMKGDVIGKQLSCRKKQLEGAPQFLDLPTDFPRPAVQSDRGSSESIILPFELSEGIKSLSQRERVTPFMTMLAAFNVLLFRYTGVDDILVGSPIANRTRMEIEDLIGFFINMLVLRSDMSGSPTFREFLSRVREASLEAYDHQELPFEKLVEEMQHERSLSYTPLFQVMFVFQNAPSGSLEMSNLTLTTVELESRTSQFDLSLVVRETDHGLRVLMEYKTDLFYQDTIKRMLGHLCCLLEGILDNPDLLLFQLPLLTENEKQQLQVWNQTVTRYPENLTIIDMFQDQVENTPDNIAVAFEGQRLSYRQLNQKANQLAHHLMTLGVRSETLVGICVERSMEMLIGIMGILKSGGAYVPLDPDYPQDRLRFMIEDSEVNVLLSQSNLLEWLQVSTLNVVCLDSEWEQIADCSRENPLTQSGPENMAYVIYTSGSTGKPKGVMVDHTALSNFNHSAVNKYHISQKDIILQFASINFDAAVEEIFPILTKGGCLILRDKHMLGSDRTFLKTCRERDVTILDLPTAYWQQLVTTPGNEIHWPDSVRLVIIGGEAASMQHVRRWQQTLSQNVQLLNTYGPTEATVVTSSYRLAESCETFPIGKPMPNTRIYILDAHHTSTPPGIPGELCIAGLGLARGYLNRLEQTSEKFIEVDIFGRRDRIYKTGDLARWLPDGNLEYLGRLDYQVKLRGFRIELSEIEVTLSLHESVRDAVVVLYKKDLPRLVAYVTVVSDLEMDEQVALISQMRTWLKTRLPEYMLPASIMLLDKLPLSPNGKIDRKALPEPDERRPEMDREFVGPSSPVETKLVEIWSILLKLNAVGVNDNFFELGGHSLLATQLISRISDTFQVDIPLRKVFEAPTVCRLAKCVTKALQSTRQLQIPPLKKIQRQKKMSLSFAQQRLWFLDQLEQESSLYNISSSFRLTGVLDVPALHKSLDAIVLRHETLRTSFRTEKGMPFQIINHSTRIDLPVVDLTEVGESKRESELLCLISEETQKPFNLSEGPLIRCTLLRLDEHDHVMHLAMHHIISDGWSIGIFKRELSSFYNDFSLGILPAPVELPIQYADFAQWQRQWLKGEALRNQLSYWKDHLEGALLLLDLPTDRPRPAVQTYRGSSESIILSCELSDAIKSLSSREGCTPFMTMLAAFKVLLYRYTGVADILVGTPIANRTRVEIESLIGFFVNTLVLRSDLSGDPSFCEFMHRVRYTALEAYAHQDLPFEKLVEDIRPERSLSHSPLFQVMFVFQNTQPASLDFSNLTLTPVKADTQTSKFDLTLFIIETDQGFRVLMEYNTDLFNRDSIVRMLGHFQTLLESIVNNPDVSVSALPILTEVEQDQLLLEWNDTKVDYPQDRCIHQLFEAQVGRTPEAVAVQYEDLQLTYRELNGRSNQLAHYLIKYGVGPDVLVGIFVERSHMMLVGVLAILKAGGAYVPLDPTLPEKRLAFFLKDTQVRVLLTEKSLVKAVPEIKDQPLVCLDIELTDSYMESGETLECRAGPGDSAYVIYTSGSTGKPKGVSVPHRAAVNFLTRMLTEPGLTDHDALLAVTTLSFDITLLELFLPLIVGARTIIASHEAASDGNSLLKILKKYDITLMQATPSTWRLLLSAGWNGDSHFKVLCGGEAMPGDLMKELVHRVGSVWNMYGPTETTVWSTCVCINNVDDPVSIGRPIGNTKTYVLDKQMQLVPIGVRGELYIGGDGVSSGYINRADLTADCFVNDPFTDDINARIYKTGDVVRYRCDGNMEYLDRLDNQVKIRGFRIELGEIETVIAKHDKVEKCVVNIWKKSLNDIRLVAYLVLLPGYDVAVGDLRMFLKEELPEYMLPQHIVKVDRFPLSPSGKVDRMALSHPVAVYSDLKADFVAPQSKTEKQLAEIWHNVIGVDKVGINDNFFELGGHSLLATQLVSRIRDALQIDIPLRKVFEAPTVCRLAECVTTALQSTSQLQTPPLKQIHRQGKMPLSFAQQRLWFLDQMEEGSSFYNISSSFCFTGDLDVSALHQSLNTIVSRHETLRTSFITEEGIPFQTINQSDETDLQIVDLSDVDESKRESELRCLISEETQRPFNLSEGPLIRSTLLRLDEHDQVLHLVMHHIISDGWSLGIFMRELSVLYNDFSEGILPTHAALPIQYADFAHWQRQWLKGEPLQKQLSYWRNRLERAPSLLDLPTDRPRPSVQSYSGSSESIMLSCELSESIKSLSSREGGTPFMTMLAAFNILLYRYTGVDDVLVGTPIANRTRVEIERLIGFFVNTLVLRSDLSGDPSFREFFQRVRESALEAYAHQDLPFEKLVEEIQPERSLSHSPLFQVMFVFQNTQPLSSDFSNLTLSPVKVDTQTSKFDLTLFIIEKAQGFRLLMEFNTDLFNRDSIVRMLGHFQTLLESIVKNPEFSVSALPILNEAEKKQLLFEWNDTKAHYTQDETIVDLFQAQVERTPDDIAVVFENQQLSYRLLNRKANQLAHYLLSFKRETDSRSLITNDCLVGICVGRSIDMVIGLLGILKAGGAYVPLDPDYPVSRLRFILEDSMLPVLLSQSHLVERFSATQNSGTKVICMDKVREQIAVCSTENLARQGEPENVAYVIYTSGSTGKPKGTLLSHESLINYLNWALIEYNLPPGGTGVPVQSSISFDATITSLYLPLISGNRVILLPEKQEIDCLADLLRDPGMLGLIKITPAHLEALNQQLEELEYAHSTCALIIGGEALTTSQIQPWLIHAPQVRLINEYGPTESVVGCSMYDAGGRADLSGSVPIGCPIANTRIYVLDAKYNPVPLGISGELCIAGAGVAKGYLNRPELTSEKFIEIEISGKSERIYKTGDIARWLPDGNLEFLGRIDHQVKIRGFRIELGEIETVIGEHDKVCQCVVNVWKKSLSDIRLVAYVVTLPGDDLTIGELMNFLSDRLPEYMLPQHVVRVDRFPLSPAGKVNRNALPHPDHVDSDLKPDFVEPETRMEKLLAEIWQDVLGVDKVGINENFFELGGHSLLVVRLIYEIKMATGKKLGVIGFFHNPTIVQLAESLMLEGTPDESSLIMIKPGGSKVPLFWVHDTFLVDYLDQDYPLYVLIHPTQDGRLPIHSTIEDIAGYYVQEILKVRPEGPYALGGYCFWAVIALEMAQVLKKMGHEVSLLFLVNPSKKCLPAWSLGVVGRGSCGDSKSRVMYHLNNIKQLKNTEKVPYLMKKLKSLLRRYYRRLSIRIKIAICRSYLFFGRPVPQPYIRFYVYAIYAGKLLRKYASQVYGGRVVVVQSEHDYERDQSDWNKLSTHEVERHVVPESDHLNILRDTHRSVWIRWLNMYLRRIVAVSKGKGE